MFDQNTKLTKTYVNFYEEKIIGLFEKARRKVKGERAFLMLASTGQTQALEELEEKRVIKKYEIKIGKCVVGVVFEYKKGIYILYDDTSPTVQEIKYLGEK